jgi:hypothetical protein
MTLLECNVQRCTRRGEERSQNERLVNFYDALKVLVMCSDQDIQKLPSHDDSKSVRTAETTRDDGAFCVKFWHFSARYFT